MDDRTLEVREVPDGEPLATRSVERDFEEVIRRVAPHPPGTRFDLDYRTRSPRSSSPRAGWRGALVAPVSWP